MVDICEVSYGIGAASLNKYIIKLCVNIFGVGRLMNREVKGIDFLGISSYKLAIPGYCGPDLCKEYLRSLTRF